MHDSTVRNLNCDARRLIRWCFATNEAGKLYHIQGKINQLSYHGLSRFTFSNFSNFVRQQDKDLSKELVWDFELKA